MVTEKIELKNPERFTKTHTISGEKLVRAAEDACERLRKMAMAHPGQFPGTWPTDFKFRWGENNNWVTGMYTGCYWLAYELTGDPFFRKEAESQLES